MNSSQLVAGAAITAVFVLAGCSGTLIEGKKIDYKSAGNVKPLDVPADLSKPPTSDRYNIPEPNAGSATASEYTEGQGTRVAAGPPPVLPPQDKVRFERAGSQRWLVVDAQPEALWPVIKEFWLDNGFLIDIDSPAIGIMETDWAENRAKIPDSVLRKLIGKVLDSAYSYPERDKFRTRLERDQDDNGSTEVYISHRGMAEINIARDRYTETTKWEVRPVDPELEAEMLSRLAIRLGAREEQITAQAKAPELPKATISKQGELPEALLLVDSFDRAWRRVGLALDRVGFTVEDRDRSKGMYFVRYVDVDATDKNKSEGFWSKLAFWRDGPKKDEQYRISVAGATQGSEVKVLDAKGVESASPTAGRILALLQQELK